LLILYDILQEGGPLSHDAFHESQSIIRETFRENGALIHAIFHEHLSLILNMFQQIRPILVAVRSKEYVFDRSTSWIAGSNLDKGMDVCLLYFLCIV